MIEDKYNLHRFLEAQISFGIYNRAVGESEVAIGFGSCFRR